MFNSIFGTITISVIVASVLTESVLSLGLPLTLISIPGKSKSSLLSLLTEQSVKSLSKIYGIPNVCEIVSSVSPDLIV